MLIIDSKELKSTGSILNLQDGVIMKSVDNELCKVLDNIEDNSTDPTKKRKIKIELEFEPSASRNSFNLNVAVSSTLAPKNSLQMSMDLKNTEDGGFILEELMKQAEGQMNMDGNETSAPARITYEANSVIPFN